MRLHRQLVPSKSRLPRAGTMSQSKTSSSTTSRVLQRRSNCSQQQAPSCGHALACSGAQLGRTDDPLEREADRVADSIVNGGQRAISITGSGAEGGDVLRRTPRSPYSIHDGELVPGEELTDVQAKVQTKPAASATPCPACHAGAEAVSAALHESGQRLAMPLQRQMESRFGEDFSKVRVHTGARADTAANAVQARAFTRGEHIVFARGQYRPEAGSGQHLLAHELTHVVQQGASAPLPEPPLSASHGMDQSATAATVQRMPNIHRDSNVSTLRRVKWSSAKDTGADSFPWGSPGPLGDVFKVETDAGTKVDAWKPHDGKTFWCHGFTFGGSAASNGPFSLWGADVPTVLNDDGWRHTYGCMAQRSDILVFADQNVAHSGIIESKVAPSGRVDENASTLDSKWGQLPQNVSSWLVNANQYGRYEAFSKQPLTGVCNGSGANER